MQESTVLRFTIRFAQGKVLADGVWLVASSLALPPGWSRDERPGSVKLKENLLCQ